jgi:saccharopine dehydrogenase-like NADP-dependent oxidoreductase
MQRTTGWPASVTALLLADGSIARRGVLRNEVDVPWPTMEAALARRGVAFTVSDRAE